LNEVLFIWSFYDMTRLRLPFNSVDRLIEVTTWADLTVYISHTYLTDGISQDWVN
jgi:hypothetical protein